MASMDPAVVVPGHGPLCGKEGLLELREYFALVREQSGVISRRASTLMKRRGESISAAS
jgi:hypothetical protein